MPRTERAPKFDYAALRELSIAAPAQALAELNIWVDRWRATARGPATAGLGPAHVALQSAVASVDLATKALAERVRSAGGAIPGDLVSLVVDENAACRITGYRIDPQTGLGYVGSWVNGGGEARLLLTAQFDFLHRAPLDAEPDEPQEQQHPAPRG